MGSLFAIVVSSLSFLPSLPPFLPSTHISPRPLLTMLPSLSISLRYGSLRSPRGRGTSSSSCRPRHLDRKSSRTRSAQTLLPRPCSPLPFSMRAILLPPSRSPTQTKHSSTSFCFHRNELRSKSSPKSLRPRSFLAFDLFRLWTSLRLELTSSPFLPPFNPTQIIKLSLAPSPGLPFGIAVRPPSFQRHSQLGGHLEGDSKS